MRLISDTVAAAQLSQTVIRSSDCSAPNALRSARIDC